MSGAGGQAPVVGDTLWRCPECSQWWLEDGEGAQDMDAECGPCGAPMTRAGSLTALLIEREALLGVAAAARVVADALASPTGSRRVSGHSSEGTARVEECGCGLWICRECRPKNFDPKQLSLLCG